MVMEENKQLDVDEVEIDWQVDLKKFFRGSKASDMVTPTHASAKSPSKDCWICFTVDPKNGLL